MRPSEIVPYDSLAKVLDNPVCDLSETLWLKFLLHLTKNPDYAQVQPKPKNYIFWDYKKNRELHGLGIHKHIIGRNEFGEKTILSVTGPLAGAVCLALRKYPEYENRWGVNSAATKADAVALRMIRRDFEMLPPMKKSFQGLYGFEVRDEVGTGWFSEVLISLLAQLDWEHDAAQIEANATDVY